MLVDEYKEITSGDADSMRDKNEDSPVEEKDRVCGPTACPVRRVAEGKTSVTVLGWRAKYVITDKTTYI